MNWVVAVPSYNRPELLAKKTLTTLHEGGVPASKIFVFVVADQLDDYKKATDASTYNKLVVGKKGLVNQRQFVIDYFPKDQLIVFMDDDIRAIKKKVGNHLVDVTNIPEFFTLAFDTMKKEGANLWGVVAAANPLFMKGGVSTDLKYIIGALYGIRNTKDPALELEYGDNQEDKERTMLYWKRDGKVVRMNSYTIVTAFYAPGGMDRPERKADTKKYTELLIAKYPGYLRQIYKPKTGIYDLRFLRKQASEDTASSSAGTKTRKEKTSRTNATRKRSSSS